MDELRKTRLEQIAWASKFKEEQNNVQRCDWMKAYVDLVDGVEEWKELSGRKDVAELLKVFNEVEFLRKMDARQLELLRSEPLLEEALVAFESASKAYITASEVKSLVSGFNKENSVVEILPGTGKFDFYDSFEQVENGPVVLYTVDLPPSSFEGTDTMTFVISIPDRKVVYLIGHNGFPIWLGANKREMSDEEWGDLGLDEV